MSESQKVIGCLPVPFSRYLKSFVGGEKLSYPRWNRINLNDTPSYVSVDSLGVYLFLKYLLNFCQTCILHHVLVKMVLRLLENAFVIQNIESIHFYSCPKQRSHRFLSLPPRENEITHFPQALFFQNLFLPTERGERKETMELQKWPKLNIVRVLATSVVKSYLLCTLHFFCFCFLVP